jgi:hypothetical protein
MPKLKETSTILAAHLQEKETGKHLNRCLISKMDMHLFSLEEDLSRYKGRL